jgi:hypothetical protein
VKNISERFHKEIVNVAIAPLFARLEGFNDGVPRPVKVLRGVFVLRLIAAADVAA